MAIDATTDDGTIGRKINHSRHDSNLVASLFKDDHAPRVIFTAKRLIKEGEELLYDYGEKDAERIKANPWLTARQRVVVQKTVDVTRPSTSFTRLPPVTGEETERFIGGLEVIDEEESGDSDDCVVVDTPVFEEAELGELLSKIAQRDQDDTDSDLDPVPAKAELIHPVSEKAQTGKHQLYLNPYTCK